MDFSEKIKEFSERVNSIKDSISTEEATKTAIILPFFSALGYDIFNPNEFLPEFVADIGIKKGEKVDYAIILNGEPVILIEAKAINKNLEKHDSQLFRYFATTKAKFAILTNGIKYLFYTDIEEVNKMDTTPFLEIDILNLNESSINELKRFIKSNFNIDEVFSNASILKYINSFKLILSKQLECPTDNFIKVFLQDIYKGPKTQNIIEKFRPILKKSLTEYINDSINEKIKLAINSNNINTDNEKPISTQDKKESKQSSISDIEQEAFFAVKNILKNTLDMNDINYKVTESYLAVIYKNNTRKWICRFICNTSQKTLIIQNKEKIKLNAINDIYRYEQDIIAIANGYINQKPPYVVDLVRHTPYKKRTKPNKHLTVKN